MCIYILHQKMKLFSFLFRVSLTHRNVGKLTPLCARTVDAKFKFDKNVTEDSFFALSRACLLPCLRRRALTNLNFDRRKYR